MLFLGKYITDQHSKIPNLNSTSDSLCNTILSRIPPKNAFSEIESHASAARLRNSLTIFIPIFSAPYLSLLLSAFDFSSALTGNRRREKERKPNIADVDGYEVRGGRRPHCSRQQQQQQQPRRAKRNSLIR